MYLVKCRVKRLYWVIKRLNLSVKQFLLYLTQYKKICFQLQDLIQLGWRFLFFFIFKLFFALQKRHVCLANCKHCRKSGMHLSWRDCNSTLGEKNKLNFVTGMRKYVAVEFLNNIKYINVG